jgi:putative Mg2+ transporter-C (MgtC) family protein
MINDFIDTHLLQLQILGQVALAMLLGALIGFDREFSKKPAGLRTHMLVAGAAGLIVKLAELAIIQFEGISGLESLRFDPIRVFVAVVTGVSFLGAGTIIRQGQDNRVEGLTTAASLLFSAVIGMTVAFSEYFLAISLALLAFIILWAIGRLEKKFKK